MKVRAVILLGLSALLAGCLVNPNEMIEAEKKAKAEREKAAQARAEKKSIIHQTTQEITEYDPNAGREVSDLKIEATDPVFGPLQAYGPMAGKISVTAVDMHLATFNAVEGRFPKDFQEFMERIIYENNVRLPVLPARHEYQYDVANHRLLVVKPLPEAPPGGAPRE